LNLPFRFIELDSVESTMTEAAARLSAGKLVPWTTILARHQTHGRGRLDRDWANVPGHALLATVVVPLSIPSARAGLVAIAAGTSVARALRDWGVVVKLKWPNDIYLDHRKLGGVLIHSRLGTELVALIGIGINLMSAPQSVKESAISLADVMTDPPPPRELMETIVRDLHAAVSNLEAGDWQLVIDEWTQSALWVGEHVTILADHEISGRFTGIDQFGRMILDTGAGELEIATGDVRRGPRIGA
jgi:BirA family transcriptional regulator, biotin operon repressor / biotin---[acetyl-CoA-carboxylase] ligase